MPDRESLGAPSSYLAARSGIAVLASDGSEVGTLEHVIADDASDIFEGIVLKTPDWDAPHRYVPRDDVEEFHERGVLLSIPAEQIRELHRPSEEPDDDSLIPQEMQDRLRRAWERISGG